MKDYRDIILAPIISEQSQQAIELGKYTFKVAKNANKIEVATAIEHLFGVKVAKVNILNVKPRTKNFGRTPGTISGYKKAVVTLKPGEQIDLFGEEE